MRFLYRLNVLNTKPDECFADCGNQQIENRNPIGLETVNGKPRDGSNVQELIVRVHSHAKQNHKHTYCTNADIYSCNLIKHFQAFGLQNSLTIKSFSNCTELIKAFVSASFEYRVTTEGLSCYL